MSPHGLADLKIARATLSLSVVSHGQAALVCALLNDLQACAGGSGLEVLLTVNVPAVAALTFTTPVVGSMVAPVLVPLTSVNAPATAPAPSRA